MDPHRIWTPGQNPMAESIFIGVHILYDTGIND